MKLKTVLDHLGDAIACVVAVPAYLLLKLVTLIDGDGTDYWTESACRDDGGR